MRELIYPQTKPNRKLNEIAFYRNAMELFTLSRKINTNLSETGTTIPKCRHLELIATDLSEQILQLPLPIAQAETSGDYLKKYQALQSIKRTISYILLNWSILKGHSSLNKVYSEKLDRKVTSLKKSYKEWSLLLTHSN